MVSFSIGVVDLKETGGGILIDGVVVVFHGFLATGSSFGTTGAGLAFV